MKKSRRETILLEIVSYSKMFFFTLAITYLINNTLIANAQVPTGSMENTIETGSRVVINRLAYLSDAPKRGDIISFHCPDEDKDAMPYLKRIIGLPGESIQGEKGVIYIDGSELKENYIKEISYYDFGPFMIPENSYFVMGDNRNDSWDARYWRNKFVDINAVIGKAEFKYYPEFTSFHSQPDY